MDQIKTGELIRKLRTRLGLTQKQLAQHLSISDKAVSKWERGSGCPDVSVLPLLADIFGTGINVLLCGELESSKGVRNDMKDLRFYVCPDCGSMITASTEASVVCCSNRLSALEAKKAAPEDMLKAEEIGDELQITGDHEMTKQHHISFIAYVGDSSMMMFRQYPEWELRATLPVLRFGRLYWYCTKHGLMYHDL